MPRPKRTKIAPSAPITRVASAIPKNLSSPQSSVRAATNSDDSEGLVKRNRTGVNRRGVARQDARMSGALAPEDTEGARLRPPTGRQRAALSKVARDADHTRAIEALKRRRDEALAKTTENEKGEEVLIPSSMPNMAENPKTNEEEATEVRTVERVRPASISKAHTTPAMDASVLAIANFKRRPRQPSILQLGRQIAQTNGSDNDEELDDFQPDDESTPFHFSKSRLRIQSTPTSLSLSPHNLPSLDSRKRKLTPPELQVPRSQSSVSQANHEHLRLEDEPVSDLYGVSGDEEEPPLPATRTTRPPSPQIWSDTMAPPQSSSPSQESPKRTSTAKPPEQIRNNRTQPSHPFTITSTPKPPAEAVLPSKTPPSTKSRKPNTHLSKAMTTATLQNLLPRRRRRPPKRHAGGGEFDIPSSSDAEIIDTTALSEDEDELSFHAPAIKHKRRRNDALVAAAAANKKNKNNKQTASKTTKDKRSAPSRIAQTTAAAANAAKQPPPTKGKVNSAGAVKTYTRRVSDKENASSTSQAEAEAEAETGHDDGSMVRPRPATNGELELEQEEGGEREGTSRSPQDSSGIELKKLAMKFKEVDRWALEFEEVTASSSSPWDAR
ncbi:hypothetical protein MMC24_000774 [Lignoscripta atroalba]|nr:hypothetical protein [Lignoscripta atroalba]